MTLARFSALLDAYGGEPSRWPESERAAAEAFLRSDAEARRLCADAAKLDGLLAFEDAASAVEASAALRARVAEIPIRHAHAAKRPGGWFFQHAFSAALVGALVAALGVLAGAVSGEPEDGSTQADAAQTEPDAAAQGEDDGWDDLTAIAFAEDLAQEP